MLLVGTRLSHAAGQGPMESPGLEVSQVPDMFFHVEERRAWIRTRTHTVTHILMCKKIVFFTILKFEILILTMIRLYIRVVSLVYRSLWGRV